MTINKYLYSRDSAGKVRVLIISIVEITHIGNSSIPVTYSINRHSGLLDGKWTAQPSIAIEKGKAGRTIKEQVELQVNSIINKQRDKGYKLLSELTTGDVNPLDHAAIDSLLPKLKTYVNGNRKLMLAKDPKPGNKYFKDGNPTAKWLDFWWISRKLDGIRVAINQTKDSFSAFSRTGKNLDVACTKILKDLDLLRIIQYIGEDKMIDGEIYKHGKRLQHLAGTVALKDYDPTRHDELEFWIFDYADETSTAEERARILNSLIPLLKGTTIKINPQLPINSYSQAIVLHDKWVKDGFEGAVLRKADALYGYGKRDDRMLKLKAYQDDEFEVIDYKLGLRGAEDMCFICKTEDGKTFDPKPIGDKQVKLAYVADMENIIGKMATVKFFNYTEDGVPSQPVLVAIRDYE